jgi:hypothetical protein
VVLSKALAPKSVQPLGLAGELGADCGMYDIARIGTPTLDDLNGRRPQWIGYPCGLFAFNFAVLIVSQGVRL